LSRRRQSARALRLGKYDQAIEAAGSRENTPAGFALAARAALADAMLKSPTLEAGQRDFAAAFKSAPDNLVLRYQYALSLGGLDPNTCRD
jgi:hypothetical protein